MFIPVPPAQEYTHVERPRSPAVRVSRAWAVRFALASVALIYVVFAALGVWLWVPLYWWLLLFLAYALLSVAWQWSVFPLRSWRKGRLNGIIVLPATILTGALVIGTFAAIPVVFPSYLARYHPWQWHYLSPDPDFEFLMPYGNKPERNERGFRVFQQTSHRLWDGAVFGSFEAAFRRFPEIDVPDPAILGWHALATPNAQEVAHGKLDNGIFWTESVIGDGQPNGHVVGIRKVYYARTGIWVLEARVGDLGIWHGKDLRSNAEIRQFLDSFRFVD